MTNELKEIPNYTGYYASSDGKIYSCLAQGCRDRYNLAKRVEPHELKYRLVHGYARVYIRNDKTNVREDVYVHRIVAMLFLPKPELDYDLLQVNHKNGDRQDNRIENLEWVTAAENLAYAREFGDQGRDELGRFKSKKLMEAEREQLYENS